MVSDVPLGAFLSGGIDSSLVVALMQEQSASRVKTFTIHFENPRFDESVHAAAVAKHLGTEHYEETCTTREMIEIVSRLPDYFDEPFADPSAIPTYLVSKVICQNVMVALSGDGGDELFFGYHRYHNYAKRLARMGPQADDEVEQYAHWHVSWTDAQIQTLLGRPAVHSPVDRSMRLHLNQFSRLERAPLLDLVTYLPEQILTKVDRASMAASLEARAPSLDHRVVEFSLGLPLELKWRNGEGKWLPRQLLYKRVPQTLVDRPKMGFSVPLPEWFRGGLRDEISEQFGGTLLEQLGINPQLARRLWRDVLDGRDDSVDLIWTLFALTSWARRWKGYRN